jgi:hypothetical protein
MRIKPSHRPAMVGDAQQAGEIDRRTDEVIGDVLIADSSERGAP